MGHLGFAALEVGAVLNCCCRWVVFEGFPPVAAPAVMLILDEARLSIAACPFQPGGVGPFRVDAGELCR